MRSSGVLLFTFFAGCLCRPQQEQHNYEMELQGGRELMDIENVVQTVSRFARNLDADGSVRVPRQIGAAPLGPPGPYRYGYAVQDDIGNSPFHTWFVSILKTCSLYILML